MTNANIVVITTTTTNVLTFEFTAQSSQTHIIVQNNFNGTRDFYVDDVVVEDITAEGYLADVMQSQDYSPFGVVLDGRHFTVGDDYRYSFQGQEHDDEIKGVGNYINFEYRGYDPRLGRFFAVDPQDKNLPWLTPYQIVSNSPLMYIEESGEFPILVNGKVGGDDERASSKYWNWNTLKVIQDRTGYKFGKSNTGTAKGNSQFSGDFFFVDGDKSAFPTMRYDRGKLQASVDADAIWEKMKTTMVDGKITERLQLFSHSRGSSYAAGYMEQLEVEIRKRAEKEGIGFAYGDKSIVEYSVNLGPHQSNYIHYKNSETINVNVSHVGDLLSGNDATGNVINIHSIPNKDGFFIDQHANGSFVRELDFILKILENNTPKGKMVERLDAWYNLYDQNRSNGGVSKVN